MMLRGSMSGFFVVDQIWLLLLVHIVDVGSENSEVYIVGVVV